MKRMLLALVLGGWAAIGAANAATRVAIAVSDSGNHFYAALGDYYQVAPERVTAVHQRNIADEELPVVFFIAQQARVNPDDVAAYRLRHKAWRDVAKHFGLGPDAFYVELKQANGPYGRPYANYHRYRRDQWRKVKLQDDDVVNFVNLRFLSEHYKVAPDQIVQWRADGRKFADMDRDLYRPAGRPPAKPANRHERKGLRDDQDRRDRPNDKDRNDNR